MNIDKDFYCENRQDEAMLPCGEQCSTCKSMNHPKIEVSGITPEEPDFQNMKSPEYTNIAQWAVENRWPKGDGDKIGDFEYYIEISERIEKSVNLEYNAAIQKAIEVVSKNSVQSRMRETLLEELEKLKK